MFFAVIHLISRLQYFRADLVKHPPHRNRFALFIAHIFQSIVYYWAMSRSSHFKAYIFTIFYLDDLSPDLQIFPMVFEPHLIWIVGIHFFSVKINVVVFKHRQAPSDFSVVTHQSKGRTGEISAIDTEIGNFNMCFVPSRWHRMTYVRIIRQNHLTRFGFTSCNHPRIAANERRNRQGFQNFVNCLGNLAQGFIFSRC